MTRQQYNRIACHNKTGRHSTAGRCLPVIMDVTESESGSVILASADQLRSGQKTKTENTNRLSVFALCRNVHSSTLPDTVAPVPARHPHCCVQAARRAAEGAAVRDHLQVRRTASSLWRPAVLRRADRFPPADGRCVQRDQRQGGAGFQEKAVPPPVFPPCDPPAVRHSRAAVRVPACAEPDGRLPAAYGPHRCSIPVTPFRLVFLKTVLCPAAEASP